LTTQNLDLTITAETYLYKSIQKDKTLSSASSLPNYVNFLSGSSQEPAVANVTARLYNSKPVKDAVAEALTNMRVVLGVATKPTQSKKKRVDEDVKPGKPVNLAVSSINQAQCQNVYIAPMTEQGLSGSEEDDEGREPDMSSIEGGNESDMWADLSLDEDALEAFDERLAESSEDGSHGLGIEARRTALRRDLAGNLSISSEPTTSPVPEPDLKSKSIKATNIVRAKTDFLPSLTMGGYWSGSESGPEDDVDVAPRKNRRGQRARQQIWEKKYGKGAKHIQNTNSNRTSGRDDGWDAKRGAQESGGARRRPDMNNRPFSKDSGPQRYIAIGGNAIQVVPRNRVIEKAVADNKPLHPSWEAAKKAKEQKQTAAFAGKKVTFD